MISFQSSRSVSPSSAVITSVGDGPNGNERPSSSGNHDTSFTLTDSGVPVPADEPLRCPVCQAGFEAGQVRELEFHVEEHLRSKVQCPMCNAEYDKDDRAGYATHVEVRNLKAVFCFCLTFLFQSHFGDEEPEVVDAPRPTAPVSAPTVAHAGFFGDWELDID